MKKNSILLLSIFLFSVAASGQVPFDKVVQDKNEMADSYYGTFKYQGEAYTGNAIAYHENGKIKTLRCFKGGKYNGMWTEWYANGNRKFQGDRVDNKGHGLTKWWHENGQLKKQGTYDMDTQVGVVVYWHPNGQIKEIQHYENGKKIGGFAKFDEQGIPIEEGIHDQ